MSVTTLKTRARLVTNLERLMAANPDVDTAPKLSKRCYWPADSSKRGERVSERTIRNVLNLRQDDQPSPTLDVLAALGAVFGLEVWELLADPQQLRKWLVDRAFTGDPDATLPGNNGFLPGSIPPASPRAAVHRQVKRRTKA